MSGTTNNSQRAIPDDTKPRRSTKVSGKLKVLPEQPEPGPVPTKRALLAPAQGGEGSNATGDSDDDDGDGGPDEDETEDVDVRFSFPLVLLLWLMRLDVLALASPIPPTPYSPHTHWQHAAGRPNRCTIRSRECPREPPVAMLYVSRRRKQSLFLA